MCHSYKPLVPKSESSLIVIFKAEMHWRGHVLRSKIHCVLSWKIIYSRHNLHNKYSLTSSFSPTTFAFFTRPVDPNLVSNGGWWISSRGIIVQCGLPCPCVLKLPAQIGLITRTTEQYKHNNGCAIVWQIAAYISRMRIDWASLQLLHVSPSLSRLSWCVLV